MKAYQEIEKLQYEKLMCFKDINNNYKMCVFKIRRALAVRVAGEDNSYLECWSVD